MARLDLSQRAEVDELMDGPCSYEDMRDCLRDLAVVNRLVMAHRPILRWLEGLVDSLPAARLGAPVKIVDVGCGYGDLLRRIEEWAGRRGLKIELVGIDMSANAVRAAREASPPASAIEWVEGDACFAPEAAHADVVIVSAVMHHLQEAEIVRLLAWMEATAALGWMVCDLHRQVVPYRVFDVVMRGPWWHRFIRPDGLTSIRRSFVPEDWRRMCSAAGVLREVEIREYRPARLCVERVRRMGAENPTHRGETAMNGAPGDGVVVRRLRSRW